MIALIWEVYNDRDGDLNKGFDIITRVILLWAEVCLFTFVFYKPILTSALFSIAIFFLFFDYIIAYVLIKNGKLEPPKNVKYHWFTYTGKKGLFDNMKWWKFSPWVRLGIKLAFFLVSLILFVKI